ncbi:2544_t:CDS:1, partial [Ambispora leptoticha]
DILYSLNKSSQTPLNFLWDRICPHCSVTLLTGESSKFCCNNRKRVIPPLPVYPIEINDVLNDPNISASSRKLNALFSFTAIGIQGQFVQLPAPSSVSISGQTYHCILPANIPNHSIHWYLYDEQERYYSARNREILYEWVSSVQNMLTLINPYVYSLQLLRDNFSSTAFLELQENTSIGEVATVIHANNT